MKNILVICIFLFSFINLSLQNQNLIAARNAHLPDELSETQLQYLADLSNIAHIQEVLNNLLVPRVVGTPAHKKVGDYIIEQLKNVGWSVEVDEFQSKTPKFGVLTFSNIIATLNPEARRFLVLACHYDSKYFENQEFIGATDSAVPCAMMINMAKVLEKEFAASKNRTDLSLKMIFFDGEEAFVNWGPNDSIYGAKHLASKWNNEFSVTHNGELSSTLVGIDVLILLDLLGASNPQFYNFFQNTQKWYERLYKAEEQLMNMGLLKNSKAGRQPKYFKRSTTFSFIEDDHIPFLQRGVPILHIIPMPFPKVWHTLDDNQNVIDMDTTENLCKILRIFVAEYLHLLKFEDQSQRPIQHKEL